MSVLATLLAACCSCLEPELSAGLFDGDGPPPVATRRAADPEELERIDALLKRQDELILARRSDEAAADYEPEFESRDFDVDSARDLLRRWDDFVGSRHDTVIASSILHADRIGEFLVADVRRLVKAVRACDGVATEEQSFETVVLRDRGGKLVVSELYENEASKAARLDRAARKYDARAELRYSLRIPEPFVAVPRSPPGAALDDLLLIDPADDTTLGLMLWDPTVDESLEELAYGDLAGPSTTFLVEPKPFERAPPAFATALQAEVEVAPREEKPGKGPLPPRRKRTMRERVVYLTPDKRMVFAAWLRAPAERFDAVKGKVDELVRSLRLSEIKPGRPYHQALLEVNEHWKTLQDGIWRPSATSIEVVIPPGLAATPLLGDHVLRLRLKLIEDLDSTLIVRLFPSGENRISAKKLLENSVQRMTAFACAEGAGGDSQRLEGFVDVLGQHGDWNRVEITCPDGSRRSYQIVAVDRADCQVQVQLLPGSGKIDVQSAALRKVLDALRVRGETPAPATTAKPDGDK